MKTLIIISVTLVGLFVILQSFVMLSTSGIEKHEYKVIKAYDDFEVRSYESALFSSVIVNDTTYEASSNKGFRVLAGYIFGGNEEGEKNCYDLTGCHGNWRQHENVIHGSL